VSPLSCWLSFSNHKDNVGIYLFPNIRIPDKYIDPPAPLYYLVADGFKIGDFYLVYEVVRWRKIFVMFKSIASIY